MDERSRQSQTNGAASFGRAVDRDPQGKGVRRRQKTAVDGLLAVCLVLLVFAPSGLDVVHRVAGIAIAALLAVHIYQHKSWFFALSRGRWPARRTRRTALVVLVFVCMAALVISGFLVPGTRSEFDVVGATTSVGELHRFMSLVGLAVTIPHAVCSSRR